MTAPVTDVAITVACFEWVAHLAVSRYCQPFSDTPEDSIEDVSRLCSASLRIVMVSRTHTPHGDHTQLFFGRRDM
jgi:hypothetical protein